MGHVNYASAKDAKVRDENSEINLFFGQMMISLIIRLFRSMSRLELTCLKITSAGNVSVAIIAYYTVMKFFLNKYIVNVM